jgi:hypothetical protein
VTADHQWIQLRLPPGNVIFNHWIHSSIVLKNPTVFFEHFGTTTSTPLYLSTYTEEFKYITNPCLKADINTAIKNIQANIDIREYCLKSKKSRFLILAAYYHNYKDVKRIFESGPRYNMDSISTREYGQWYSVKHSSHERGTTLKPHPRNRHRAGSPHPGTHNKQIKRIAQRKAICTKCGSLDIGFIGRWKKDSHGEGQLEAGTDPDTIKADGNGREDTGMQSWGSGRKS